MVHNTNHNKKWGAIQQNSARTEKTQCKKQKYSESTQRPSESQQAREPLNRFKNENFKTKCLASKQKLAKSFKNKKLANNGNQNRIQK